MKLRKLKKYYKLILPSFLAVAFFTVLLFLVWKASLVPQHSIYVSQQNINQGDTLLIKLSGKYPLVKGQFNNKEIIFFHKGKFSDWSGIVGIDADLEPGNYEIAIDASGEKMERAVVVLDKEFISEKKPSEKKLRVPGFSEQKVIDNIKNNDNPILVKALSIFTPQAYFVGEFTYPLNKMKRSGFDFGQYINTGNYQLQHFGIDLEAPMDTKIYAINSGKVVLEENLLNYGKTIVVDHGLGIFSLYLHLDSFKVALGDTIKKDQVIGLSGSSGLSTAPHLHFSIKENGARVDPVLFIKQTENISGSFNLASLSRRVLEFFNIYR